MSESPQQKKANCIICNILFTKRSVRNVCCSQDCTKENRKIKCLLRYRERYKDPTFRAAEIERNAKRWHANPDHREKVKANTRTEPYREKARLRLKKRMQDPAYREKTNEYRRKYYQENPQYREKSKEHGRLLHQNPEFKEKKRAKNRERYQNDPVFRQMKLESVKKSYWKAKEQSKDSDVV